MTRSWSRGITNRPLFKYDSNNKLIGIYNRDRTLTTLYGDPATWYPGEVASVRTPLITADGDLATATDQVPHYWRVVINAASDAGAAQALLDGGPNVKVLIPGAASGKQIFGIDDDSVEVSRVDAICVSTASSAPANWTGGSYMMSAGGMGLAGVEANMAAFNFSSVSGGLYVDVTATPIYNTNFTDLIVMVGVPG